MPKNLEVTVEDQNVHIQPLTAQALTDAVKALVAVQDGEEINTSTEKPGLLGIKVSLSLATRAGLIDGDPESNAKGASESAVDNGKALADAEAQRQAEADDKAAQVLAEREEAERVQAQENEAARLEAEAAEKAAAGEAAPKSEPASDGTADAPAEELTPAQKAANTRKAKEAAARAAAEKAADQG